MPTNTGKAVVITGASTGIGAACALNLARIGFHVYAGVRRDADGSALKEKANGTLTPIRIDVTDAPSIDAAAESISAELGDAGLAGLVNNAGISVNGPLEFLPIDQLRRQLEVNVIGQVAVTQAFIPLIRKARGRIVNIGSTSGRLTIPLGGPYCASKYAIEAITDALRLELKEWGIEVSVVQPGAIDTPIWEKTIGEAVGLLDSMPEGTTKLYGSLIDRVMQGAKSSAKNAIPAQRVADCVIHALTAPNPKTRYLVGKDARVQMLLTWLPDRMRDKLIMKFIDKAV